MFSVLGAALLWSQAAAAQDGGRVLASAEPSTLEVGQTFDYTLKIVSDGQATLRLLERPDFGDMQVLGTSQGSEFRSINGKAELTQSIRFRVAPRRDGTFTLRGAQAEIGGKKVDAPGVKITVHPAGKAPPPAPGTPTPDEPVVLRMNASTVKPWVGQLVLLEYAIFLDEGRLSPMGLEVRDLKEPSFDGFWIENLSEYVRDGRRRQTLQGREYLVRIVQLQGVFPLQPGPYEIPAVEMEVEFGSFGLLRSRSNRLVSAPLTLDVQPLPAGAPKGFDPSNVGVYQLEVEADRRKVRVGEPVTVRITVRGSGYVGRVELPQLPPLDGARALDPVIDRQLHRSATTVGGAKTAEIVLIPTQTGVLTLPALRFDYFDPEQGAYRTSRSEPLQIGVAGAAARPVEDEVDVAARAESSEPPEALQIAAEPLRPLQPLAELPTDHPGESPPAWLLLLLATLLPPLGFGAWSLLQRRQRAQLRSADAPPDAAAALKAARARLKAAAAAPAPEAWAALTDALAAAAAPRLGLPAARLSGSRLVDELRRRGAAEDLCARINALHSAASEARFAGAALPPSPQQLDEARSLLDALQEVP